MRLLNVGCACGNCVAVPESAFGTSVTCPRCGADIYVSLSSLRADAVPPGKTAPPADTRSPEIARARLDAAVMASTPTEHCARCGRPFRGDWDRHMHAEGTVCNICANRAEPVDPHRSEMTPAPAAPAKAPPQRRMLMPEYTQVTPYIIEAPRPKPRRDLKKMKREAIVLGVAFVITMLAILFLPVDGISDREWEQPGELSRVWGVVVMMIRIASMFAGSFIAFYVVLNQANKLPQDTFLGNFITVGPVVAGLAVLAMLPVPAPFASALLTLYVCFFVYELSFSQFVELLLFGVLANILVAALTPLLYFVIALIAV